MHGWQSALMPGSLSAAGTGLSSESASSKPFLSMLRLRVSRPTLTQDLSRSRCSICQADSYFRVSYGAGCSDRAVQELSALTIASLILKCDRLGKCCTCSSE